MASTVPRQYRFQFAWLRDVEAIPIYRHRRHAHGAYPSDDYNQQHAPLGRVCVIAQWVDDSEVSVYGDHYEIVYAPAARQADHHEARDAYRFVAV